MAELFVQYVVTSNRESGFGRYDVMLEPAMRENNIKNSTRFPGNAVIIEFKVQDEGEKTLDDTVKKALRQIEEKNYQAVLRAKGIPEDRIKKYGFAFCGKRVRIGRA